MRSRLPLDIPSEGIFYNEGIDALIAQRKGELESSAGIEAELVAHEAFSKLRVVEIMIGIEIGDDLVDLFSRYLLFLQILAHLEF